MEQTFQTISTGDSWVKGETYRLVFDVEHVKLFGVTLPDELLPDFVREQIAAKQIDAMVTKLQDDPKLRVLAYEYAGTTFSVDVLAIENPFPVALIVGGIIALALLFGVALVMREAKQLVDAGTKLAKTIGPLGTNLGIVTIAAVVLIGGFFLVKANA